jgi:hypothetical protein
MSMYEAAVADGNQGERGAVLLGMLGGPVVARFRDAWVEKSEDGPVIAVYTRQGGGNRECYCDSEPERAHVPGQCYAACNEALAAHPLYLRDADDDFDRTYATFYFRAPEQWREVLAEAAVEPVNMSERWQEAIDRIGRGEVRPSLVAMMDQVTASLGDPSPDAPKVTRI